MEATRADKDGCYRQANTVRRHDEAEKAEVRGPGRLLKKTVQTLPKTYFPLFP
jgi:hypothetical protein